MILGEIFYQYGRLRHRRQALKMFPAAFILDFSSVPCLLRLQECNLAMRSGNFAKTR